jgi:hypothetical protein
LGTVRSLEQLDSKERKSGGASEKAFVPDAAGN